MLFDCAKVECCMHFAAECYAICCDPFCGRRIRSALFLFPVLPSPIRPSDLQAREAKEQKNIPDVPTRG